MARPYDAFLDALPRDVPARCNACAYAHDVHTLVPVDVRLDGQSPVVEYPAFRGSFVRHFSMLIYDFARYAGLAHYCPANDEVSHSIRINGIWEAYETLLMLDILRQGDRTGLVLDFGVQLGWYTTLAALAGYTVVGFEADAVNRAAALRTAAMNNCGDRVDVLHHWVGDTTPVFPNAPVRFLKADIEGAEASVLRSCRNMFRAGSVDYALLEISPVFNGSYPDLVAEIADCGYVVYDVPSKTSAHRDVFEVDPLGAVQHYAIPRASLREYTANQRQTNYLFQRVA